MKRIVTCCIKGYRKVNDVLVAMGFPPSSCRFSPTCSIYVEQAIEKYGVMYGLGMGIKRIIKCHPFFKGGYDPVR